MKHCDSGQPAPQVGLPSGIRRSRIMATFTIELPESHTVTMRKGASVTVETGKIAALLPELLGYGIGQKLRDSASAASKAAEAEGAQGGQAEAQAMMDSCLA